MQCKSSIVHRQKKLRCELTAGHPAPHQASWTISRRLRQLRWWDEQAESEEADNG